MTTTSDDIIAALEEQVGCYQRLAKLSELQHEHVQHSQTDELLDVLGRRQDVLNQVSRLEQSIGPVKRRWSDYTGSLSEELRVKADHLLNETRRLLAEITTADRNDAMVLQQQKINLGRQIVQASQAKKLNRSYTSAAYGNRPASTMDLQQ